jgi:hypothetical protein
MSSPSAAKAALWMAGDRECATGRPMMPMTLLAPVTVMPPQEDAVRTPLPKICRGGGGSCRCENAAEAWRGY